MPVSGFYEWQVTEAGKQPWYITRADGEPMLLAGLAATRRREGEATLETFAILTTAANEFMAPLHDRMPVVVEPDEVRLWLRGDLSLLRPAAGGILTAVPVSTRVNSPTKEGSDLILPDLG